MSSSTSPLKHAAKVLWNHKPLILLGLPAMLAVFLFTMAEEVAVETWAHGPLRVAVALLIVGILFVVSSFVETLLISSTAQALASSTFSYKKVALRSLRQTPAVLLTKVMLWGAVFTVVVAQLTLHVSITAHVGTLSAHLLKSVAMLFIFLVDLYATRHVVVSRKNPLLGIWASLGTLKTGWAETLKTMVSLSALTMSTLGAAGIALSLLAFLAGPQSVILLGSLVVVLLLVTSPVFALLSGTWTVTFLQISDKQGLHETLQHA